MTQLASELFGMQDKKPIIIYGRDEGFSLYPLEDGLWKVEQKIGDVYYKKVIHEKYIEWL